MEILIIGAGAMGSLFGALLAPWANVCLMTTNSAHATAIRQKGVQLTDMEGNTSCTSVQIITHPDHYSKRADLVLICTKAGATSKAAETAKAILADQGLALTLQNGLGNLERIAKQVGQKRSTAGTTAQAATLFAPGHIRHAGQGPTTLAPAKGCPEQLHILTTISNLFNQAGIATTLTEDIDALLWSKLIVNVGINALVALLRIPNGALIDTPESQALMTDAVEEALTVAQALGINIDLTIQQERVRQVCELTRSNRASMLQDILRGQATEIDVINGAIVNKGREVQIPTPINALLTRLIKALESTSAQRIDAI